MGIFPQQTAAGLNPEACEAVDRMYVPSRGWQRGIPGVRKSMSQGVV